MGQERRRARTSDAGIAAVADASSAVDVRQRATAPRTLPTVLDVVARRRLVERDADVVRSMTRRLMRSAAAAAWTRRRVASLTASVSNHASLTHHDVERAQPGREDRREAMDAPAILARPSGPW